MTHEAFENLISDWLDSRDDVARAKLDALVAESPELRSVLDEWLRLDALLHEASPRIDVAVAWPMLRARISHAVDEAVVADLRAGGIDRLLRASDPLEERIDWSRLHERISSKVHQEADRRDSSQQSTIRRVLALVATSVAAAAMLVVFVSPRGTVGPTGGDMNASFVRVIVQPEPTPAPRTDAHVRVVIVDDAPSGATATLAAAGEIFLMIDPIAPAFGDLGAPGAPLGLN
ncbi:MAG: hypothetical protein ACKVS9_01760 [Phycisphaerae bacterium]